MSDNEKFSLVTAENNVKFYIVTDSSYPHRPFGVAACEDSEEESCYVENIFFTKEEAEKCCLWLAENQVIPITLKEVLENFYQL